MERTEDRPDLKNEARATILHLEIGFLGEYNIEGCVDPRLINESIGQEKQEKIPTLKQTPKQMPVMKSGAREDCPQAMNPNLE